MSIIHPKVAGAFATRPLYERFLAAAICALLGEDETEKLVDEFFGRDVDFNEIVAGKPLHAYNGKNVPQLRREGMAEKDIDAVREAYVARGAEYPEEDETPMAVPDDRPDFVPSPGDDIPPPREAREPGEKESGEAALANATEQPAPGVGGTAPIDPNDIPVGSYRFGDLRGKTDAELKSLNGIGKASIAKVRALEAQYPANPGDGGEDAPAARGEPPAGDGEDDPDNPEADADDEESGESNPATAKR